MPSQEQIDQEAGQGNVESRLAELEAWRDLMITNILGPAQFRPGLLRFGGNIMQLDNNGIQILANGSSVTALYFVDKILPTVTNADVHGYVLGRADPNVSTDWDSATLQLGGNALSHDLTKSYAGYFSTSYVTFGADVVKYGAYVNAAYSPGGVTGYLYAESTSTVASNGSVGNEFRILNSGGTNAAPLHFIGAANDPSPLSDGMVWYSSATNSLKARINGATVTLGAALTTLLLTDTAWAAKGDLAVGTANDTAQILSIGTNGTRLVADALNIATTGIGWKSFWWQTNTYTNGTQALGTEIKGAICTLSGNLTLQLPSAATIGAGDTVFVKRTDSTGFTLTIDPNGSQTIDGSLTITVAPLEAVVLVSDGSNWWRI